MVIAVDFDGTCVTHDYPMIGKDIGAVPVLKDLVAQGNQLILLTMRDEKTLQEAVEWFEHHGIALWGIQNNPTQHHWTSSRKVYAHIYIDDVALGCPLKTDSSISERSFVDWNIVRDLLEREGALINVEP